MKVFTTLDEMAAAYMEVFNNSYNNDPQKVFTLDMVKGFCVERFHIMTAKVKYGITLSAHSYYIPDYGYVKG